MKKVPMFLLSVVALGVCGCVMLVPVEKTPPPITYGNAPTVQTYYPPPNHVYPYGVPPRVYYVDPPFYPGYAWQYWYTVPAQPGFVFFFGNDGRHHRHQQNHHRR